LEIAVESILRQDYPHLELVIYDNASSDNTPEYLTKLSEKYPNINAICRKVPNRNAMQTLNQTFRASRGEYILVLDDDAYLPDTTTISKLVIAMETHPDAAIVGANVQAANGDWQMPIRTVDGLFVPSWQIGNMGTFKYFEFHGACALFRKSFVQEIGYYDESFMIYMNELDLSTRVLAMGFNVYICADVIAIHTGVGDKNACTKKVYYFIKNYNTVITRTFTSVYKRLTGVLLHSFMSGGYYFERIMIHKTCKSRFVVFKFLYYLTKILCIGIYRSFFPDKNYRFDISFQRIYENSMYNGFKRCVTDRLLWFINRKDTTSKGVR
jgi:GT2 family glycosyltransferase